MANSKSVAENDKMSLEYLVYQIPRKLSKTVRTTSKNFTAHLKKISLAKNERTGASVMIIVILMD